MTRTHHLIPVSVRTELLDCVDVNLALLCDRWYGPSAHLNLGAHLAFRPVQGESGLPTVWRQTVEQLTDSARKLGLSVVSGPENVGRVEALSPGEGCFVVADAYHLPWVPYAGNQHMEHSFLVESPCEPGTAVSIVDGYRNETPWGPARPLQRHLTKEEFARVISPGSLTVRFEAAAAGLPSLRSGTDLSGPEGVQDYVDAFARHPDQVLALERLTLETWLLSRQRGMHAAFLDRFGGAPDGVERHLQLWASVVEQSYLAFRRVQRGRPVPETLFQRLAEALNADREVFGTSRLMVAEVRTLVADILAVAPYDLGNTTPFTSLPQFNSFRLVEIVDRLEETFEFEFAPEDLLPERLRDLDALALTVERAKAHLSRDLTVMERGKRDH